MLFCTWDVVLHVGWVREIKLTFAHSATSLVCNKILIWLCQPTFTVVIVAWTHANGFQLG